MNKNRLVRLFKRPSLLYLMLGLLILASLPISGVISSRHLSHQPSKPLIYVPRASYYKSLDLSLARQTIYSNQPIQQVSGLGLMNKVSVYTVRFEVPKDGLSEYGLMTLPSGTQPQGGYPVLILCHGYVNPHSYRTTAQYIQDMEFYSQHGFAVLKPDFRGQGLSYSDGTPDGAFYSMSYNTDVMSLIAAVKHTIYLNSGEISIWGHSMGAYIALRAAVLSPDIKNVILLSAPAGTAKDLFTQYRTLSDLDNPTALRVRNNELALHGNPLSNPGFWESTSPLNYLKDTNASFEINVGADDQIVPPHFSTDLATALAHAGKKYQYYVYPRGDHGLLAQRSLIWKRSLQLLEDHK